MYIHNSYDFPDDNAETKAVGAKLEAFISLSPESTYRQAEVSETNAILIELFLSV